MTGALICAFAFVFVGFPWSARFQTLPARLGAAYLLGVGALSVILLHLSIVGIHWNVFTVAGALLILTTVGWVLNRKPHTPRTVRPALRWPIIAAVLVPIVAYGVYATNEGLWEWGNLAPGRRDFFYIWGAKGQTYFEFHGIDWRWLRDTPGDVSHPDYPPLVPILFASVASVTGHWDARWFGLLYAAFAAAFLFVVLEIALTETGSGLGALVIAISLASCVMLPQVGFAEGPLVVYSGLGLLLLRDWARGDSDPGYLPFAMLGFAALTKNEGSAILVAAAVAAAVTRKTPQAVARFWPAILIAGPWMIARTAVPLASDLLSAHSRSMSELTKRTLAVFTSMPDANLDQPIFWTAAALAILLGSRHQVRRELFLLLNVLLLFAIYVAVYVTSPWEVSWNVVGTWARLSNHFAVPLGYVAVRSAMARLQVPNEALTERS